MLVNVLGALVAIIDRKNKGNVIPAAIQMMKSLSERGNDSFGLATHDKVFLCESLRELSESRIHSSAAIGYGLNRIFSKDIPQPLADGTTRLAFEGRIYPTSEVPDCEKALSLTEERTDNGLGEFVHRVEGAYAAAIMHNGQLAVARDLLGCKPLYWGEARGIMAFASEQKALWTIGINMPRRFPPGEVWVLGAGDISVRKPDDLTCHAHRSDIDSAAEELSDLVVESIRRRSGDLKRVAIAYSGGVDSAVVASSSALAGLDVELFTVTMRGNGEVEHAKRSAEALGFPLTVKQYSLSDLRSSIPEVIKRIERADVMSLAIAVPIFWVAQLAEKEGFQAFFAGQGADELFGGYDRYVTAYQREGPEKANEMMMKDVQRIAELNLERDEQATAGSKAELRLPFSDLDLVRFALSLPIHLKIGGTDEALQKLILRRVAQLQGVPKSASERPKRAMQYATGVASSIREIAKQARITPRDYVSKQYDRFTRRLLVRS